MCGRFWVGRWTERDLFDRNVFRRSAAPLAGRVNWRILQPARLEFLLPPTRPASGAAKRNAKTRRRKRCSLIQPILFLQPLWHILLGHVTDILRNQRFDFHLEAVLH